MQLPNDIVRLIVAACFRAYIDRLNRARLRANSLRRLESPLPSLYEWMRLLSSLSVPVGDDAKEVIASYRTSALLNGRPFPTT